MSSSGQSEAAGRLQRALVAFQKVQSLLLATHRKLKGLPAEEVERFWAAQGHQIERHTQAAAIEVTAAFDAFSAAGLVASANDRRLITEARRIVADAGR
jgi:hypothetical protein